VKSGYFPNLRHGARGGNANAAQAFEHCNAACWTTDEIMLNGGLGCWHGELPELDGLNCLDCHTIVANLIATAL
jgi:hypothetical protein